MDNIKNKIQSHLENILCVPIKVVVGGSHLDYSVHMVGILKRQKQIYGTNFLFDPNTGVVTIYDNVSWNEIPI